MVPAIRAKTNAYGSGRLTAPRRAIASAVNLLDGAFTIDELTAATSTIDSDAASTATVYRAVAAMEAAGFVERVGARYGATLFARCEHRGGHHHHVVCDGCGKTAATTCPLGHASESAAPSGFIVTRHEVTLYGLCPDCAEKPGR